MLSSPDEVRAELEATDAVLGDPEAVRDFVLNAAQRLGLNISREKRADVFRVGVGPDARTTLPAAISFAMPDSKSAQWLTSFVSPTPEGAEYLGRNHRFVVAMARFLMEEALTKGGAATASRCGVIRTGGVNLMSTILLLRVRYLIEQPGRAPLLSEEVQVTGFVDAASGRDWLSDDDALRFLGEARPDANIPMAEKSQLIAAALDAWPKLESELLDRIKARSAELQKSHKRVRQAVSLRVRELTVNPQLPPDLLGVLVLQPLVE